MQTLSRDEIAALARHADLDLSPTHLDELVEVVAHLGPMLARLPRGARNDEPAHIFRADRFAVPDDGG